MDDEIAALMKDRANKVIDLVRKRSRLRDDMLRVTAGKSERDIIECSIIMRDGENVRFSTPLKVVVDDLLSRLEAVDTELEALGWRALAAPESAGQ